VCLDNLDPEIAAIPQNQVAGLDRNFHGRGLIIPAVWINGEVNEASGKQVIDSLDSRIADCGVSIFNARKHLKKAEWKFDDCAVLQQNPLESSLSFNGLDLTGIAFGKHDMFKDSLEKPHAGLIGPFPIGLATGGDAGPGFDPSRQVVVADGPGYRFQT
jgi:hypothetical protein